MSIVYRTLKDNDATISVDSTEGAGTTFTMFLKRG
jgi:chemotaxis protein histidine kinase CheA